MINLIPGIRTVQQNHAVLVERFGKYDKTLYAGLNFFNPLTSQTKDLSEWRGVASKAPDLMELTEQQHETNFCECDTKDKVRIKATAKNRH